MDPQNPQETGIKILLLDDSAPLRALLTELLDDFSFVDSIVQVNDVNSALAAFDRDFFDIAILDLNIPGEADIRNGIDLARAIRLRYPRTKVAVLTALANSMDRDASMKAGVDGFYDKGEFEALLSWIENATQRQ